ncbi:MAG: EI24 domain-containing protein [Anderseniella sp.]
MISSAFRAMRDVLSPEFRSILAKAIGLTLLVFIGVLATLWIGREALLVLPWTWLDEVIAGAASLVLLVVFFFLMAPVTAVFAGLFLDTAADIVEVKHYPREAKGKPPSAWSSALMGLQFGLLVLAVNILVLPTVFFGIGVAIMLVANAYLLGREYFTMVAMRYMPARQAASLRKLNSGRVWAAGLIPAGLALIPFLNILVPLFSTSYFVHIFKKIATDQSVTETT